MSDIIKAGVIGHPIEHSKSPIVHKYWIEAYNFNGSYEAINIAPEALKAGVQKLIDEGYAGFNVTIPHKETMLDMCDSVNHNAEAIGAVNTVVIKEGKLHGLNTDGFGFTQNIWEAAPDFEFEDKNVVILGAGGAARAITSGLIGEMVGHVHIFNRTREKAEAIKKEMGCFSDLIKTYDWDEYPEILKTADLVVNTTSLGMGGQPDLKFDLSNLPEHALVNDIVYAPLETQLLKSAKARGNTAITGIGMLIHQARPAFKEWFGLLPDVTDELRERVLK